MAKESVKTEDEVSMVLYDEHGNVKQRETSGKKSRSERLLELVKKLIANW